MPDQEQIVFEEGTAINVTAGKSFDRVSGDRAIADAQELLPGTVARYTLKISQRLAAKEIERAIEQAALIKDDAHYREQAEKILAEAKKLEALDLTSATTKGFFSTIGNAASAGIDEVKSQILERPVTVAVIVAGLAGLYLYTRKEDSE